MSALAEELKRNHTAIIDEMMSRAQAELRGTLYEQLDEQKILQLRYGNVLDVLIEYIEDPDEVLFLQHYLLIFIQRYYVNVDEQHPLTPEAVEQRRSQIVQSVNLYLRTVKKFTSNSFHTQLEQIWLTFRKFLHQMGDYINAHLTTHATRMPTLKMKDIEYDPESRFDIDPAHWP